jgi:large subunit ribosomal protein L22
MAAVETPRTEVRAEARYVRAAPRKAQLVAEQIRGRTVPEARTILTFMTRDAARDVQKVLDSAVANAETNHGLVGDDLYVSAAFVGSGPTLKRWRARARGRVARIKKRTCHITVQLALPGNEAIPEPRGSITIAPPPAEEAKPKRARAPRKKPEAEGTASEATTAEADAPAAEEKPKRAPRKKAEPKADAEKPRRASRPKKTEGEA